MNTLTKSGVPRRNASMRSPYNALPIYKKELLREKAREYTRGRPRQMLLAAAKNRAKVKGLEFNLTIDDIIIPSHCPVFRFPLSLGNTRAGRDFSPSIDRIDNSKGYIKSNIIIISFRANKIKGDASVDELLMIANFYKTLEKSLTTKEISAIMDTVKE